MHRGKLILLQLLVGVLTISVWEIGTSVPIGGSYLLPPFFFSTPVDVALRIIKWFVEGTVWRHLWITLYEAMMAFIIGSAAGVAIGFWFARQPVVAAVFDPYVKMINALPRVVLAPIFALWFGLGAASKIALGITLVFFIVFFNVYQGVREVSPTILANARMLGMNDRALMRHVYWPSALSWMFSSLHTSVGFAVVGAVVGEYLGSAAGLGYLIQQAEGVFDVAGVFAGMLVLAAFVLVIDGLVTMAERRPAGLATRPPETHPARWHVGGTSDRRRLDYGGPLSGGADHESSSTRVACAQRAGAGLGRRARADQGHDRRRWRRMPVLPADHAGAAARRI